MVLTILAMDRKQVPGETATPTFAFEDYKEIHEHANTLAGRTKSEPYVGSKATFDQFTQTIFPLAVAAREDSEGKSWQLTHFGQALKPALVWAAGLMQQQDISPMELLGSTSSKTAVQDKATGETSLTTTPQVRALILLALSLPNLGKEIETHNLEKLTKISHKGIPPHHLQPLRKTGYITYKNQEANKPMTYHSITQQGEEIVEWGNSPKRPTLSNRIYEAFVELTQGDRDKVVTYKDIARYFKEKGWNFSTNVISTVLTFYREQGYLETGMLSYTHHSDIRITEKGLAAARILGLLYLWSIDPTNVPEILTVDTSLSANQGLLKDMIDRFRQESPQVSRAPLKKIQELYTYIANSPGATQAQAGRTLGFNNAAQGYANALKGSGLLQEEAKNGNEISLSPTTHPDGSPYSEEEIAEMLTHALIIYQSTNKEKRKSQTSRPLK